MKKVFTLCEGQTEEAFVKNILVPHFRRLQKEIHPVILETKSTPLKKYRGGFSSYNKIRKDVLKLLDDSSAACVTTMLDYYGLPNDFPGKGELSMLRTPYEKVKHLEKAFKEDIKERAGFKPFYPYLSLHEFEALLFAEPQAIIEAKRYCRVEEKFDDYISQFNSPEEINDGEETHPSALIKRAFPSSYSKVRDGLIISQKIGLDKIRSKCSHFNEWLSYLEAL
ncbi:MAG: DUF4276 family protein [Blastocatellia bacterium]|nr:DUF4276 family protein [Blastocatellia bacterium]